ncbi:MAG: DUF4390 domain-containing protein [Gammaproteobacteria bacterium]|nr:DUF4390 domain-containing protein [Gammaproteobacteria bacterium]
MNRKHNGIVIQLAVLLWVVTLAYTSICVSAENAFEVRSAETVVVDNIYYLNAHIDYQLSNEAREALQNGLPLNIVLDIEVAKKRGLLWNKEIVHLKQRYQIRYYALIQQYHVINVNSGLQHSLPTLAVATSILGTIVDLPLFDAMLIDADSDYEISLRSRLDTESLPMPVRLSTYFSSGWDLSSGWYRWSLR